VKIWSIVLPMLLFPFVCSASTSGDPYRQLPFKPGEKLTYQLSWEFVPVGVAVLEVLPMTTFNSQEVHHFKVTVETNSAIDAIYKVRDRIEAYAHADMTRSVLFKKKQREGKHKRDVTVTFDWENMTAQYTNRGKEREPVSIKPGTYDPVSLFYAFRLQDLKEHSELHAPLTDGKKLVTGTAHILSKESVEVTSGKFDTYVVEPDLKEAGGVFENSEGAQLRVWISADERRIPIKVMCRAPVGYFMGELISVKIP
jgi:hypothetical protein